MSMLLNSPILAAPAAAGIQFVGGLICPRTPTSTADSSHSMSGTLTGGIASSPQAGDFVLVMYGSGSTNDQSVKVIKDTSAVAYTSLVGLYANATNDANLAIAYRMLASSPDLTVVLGSQGGSNNGGGAIILVFRGVNVSSPFDVAYVQSVVTNTGRPNPPAITPVTAGAYIVACGAHGGPNSGNADVTSSDLSGFKATSAVGTNRSGGAGAGYHAWTTGAFDPAQFGGGTTGATDAAIGVSMALRPA